MINTRYLAIPATLVLLSACTIDTTRDFGIDSGDLTAMKAGVWIDPNGCDHWIIDDGVEGYMTPRLHPDGTPVCRDEDSVMPEGNTEGFERQIVGGS